MFLYFFITFQLSVEVFKCFATVNRENSSVVCVFFFVLFQIVEVTKNVAFPTAWDIQGQERM